jgi:oligoribonuclease NrnB/cAMP/cGMP phosphodiesterase (DHH superfamily)
VRLVTRSDFDGIVCATILQALGIVDEILYVHPKDLQDSKIKVNQHDIIANLPYAQGCGLWFDHHSSEHERLNLKGRFEGASKLALSAAQVIYEYYADHQEYARIFEKYRDLIKVVGVADSAQFSEDDILNPEGWTMLAFIADPRTGLGLKRTFRISNFELMKRLPDLLRTKPVEEILALPDFQERIQVYAQETSTFRQLLGKHSMVKGNAILIDFRGIKDVPVGNRFIEYVIYPAQNISIRIADGKNKKFAMISVGHSIINRTSPVDVGSLTLKYGGGGHRHVGTCQVQYEEVDIVVEEMLQVINP